MVMMDHFMNCVVYASLNKYTGNVGSVMMDHFLTRIEVLRAHSYFITAYKYTGNVVMVMMDHFMNCIVSVSLNKYTGNVVSIMMDQFMNCAAYACTIEQRIDLAK